MAPNVTSEKVINPNEELVIPKWINEEYFQEILEKDVPDFVRIKKFTPIAATAPGENYTSIMVRVVMEVELKDGQTTTASYILKTAFETNDQGANLVTALCLFPKEKLMYEQMLPKYLQLYKDGGVELQLGPRCLHIEETPETITLVLEDLKCRNFKNADRLQGFDMQHMRSVLCKLAELHAASAAYYELNGAYDEMFSYTFFSEQNREMFEALSEARKHVYERAMHEWGLENVEHYIESMPGINEYFEEAARLNAVDPNEFNVLNHGDCWSNNIMFNYKENGDIDETLLVDFQVGKWGSPAQDLWYLIVSSAALDIKVKEYDHFIQIYHKRLVECLQHLNYKKTIPTLRDMHILMIKYGFWAFLTANGVLCAVLLPSEKDANMTMMLAPGPEGDEFRYKTFVNPYYVKAMLQLYPFLDNKGVFDCSKAS